VSSNAVEVSQPVIEARGITKRYGALTALHGVDLSVRPGEVVGLVGDNGAGKSTLIKILSGALEPTDGAVLIDGRQADLRSPLHARQQGIETVYQDLALAPDLTVAENLFIGRELKRADLRRFVGTLDRKRMNRHAQEQLERLRIRIDAVTDRADTLSGGQRQAIAVARAVAWGRRIILMDEPTAALGVQEQRKVLQLIDTLKARGIAVLVVSHNLEHVFSVADRVVVLRGGRIVGSREKAKTTHSEIVHMIVGAEMAPAS